jgi:OOP family OmpA-OmpF porin
MNKTSKIALALAFAAITASGVTSAQTVDNWRNGTNELTWKNGTNELCWQNNFWTPATASVDCGKPKASPMADKVSIKAEALFDFDKAIVKPEGRKQIEAAVAALKQQAASLADAAKAVGVDKINTDG